MQLVQVHECCCGSPEQAALQGAFQEAAAAFHIRAPECLVINSSPPGGQAAVQAGMQAVTLGKASTATGEQPLRPACHEPPAAQSAAAFHAAAPSASCAVLQLQDNTCSTACTGHELDYLMSSRPHCKPPAPLSGCNTDCMVRRGREHHRLAAGPGLGALRPAGL